MAELTLEFDDVLLAQARAMAIARGTTLEAFLIDYFHNLGKSDHDRDRSDVPSS